MKKGAIRHRNKKGHRIIGIVLTVIGLFWLAKKAGWISAAAGGSAVFWPAAVTALGLFIIFGTVHRRRRNHEQKKET